MKNYVQIYNFQNILLRDSKSNIQLQLWGVAKQKEYNKVDEIALNMALAICVCSPSAWFRFSIFSNMFSIFIHSHLLFVILVNFFFLLLQHQLYGDGFLFSLIFYHLSHFYHSTPNKSQIKQMFASQLNNLAKSVLLVFLRLFVFEEILSIYSYIYFPGVTYAFLQPPFDPSIVV